MHTHIDEPLVISATPNKSWTDIYIISRIEGPHYDPPYVQIEIRPHAGNTLSLWLPPDRALILAESIATEARALIAQIGEAAREEQQEENAA